MNEKRKEDGREGERGKSTEGWKNGEREGGREREKYRGVEEFGAGKMGQRLEPKVYHP